TDRARPLGPGPRTPPDRERRTPEPEAGGGHPVGRPFPGGADGWTSPGARRGRSATGSGIHGPELSGLRRLPVHAGPGHAADRGVLIGFYPRSPAIQVATDSLVAFLNRCRTWPSR